MDVWPKRRNSLFFCVGILLVKFNWKSAALSDWETRTFSAVRTFLICIKQVGACNFYLVMSRIKKFRVQYELPINCVNVPNNNFRQLYQRVCQVKHLHTVYTQRWICLWGLGEVKEIINWYCGASMTITWYIKLMMKVITAKECWKSQRSSLRGKCSRSSEIFHIVASRKLAQEQKMEDGEGMVKGRIIAEL